MDRRNRNKILGIIGFFFILAVSRCVFAEPPAYVSLPDLAARFEKLEGRMVELQNKMIEQNKKHREEIRDLRRQIEMKGPAEKAVYLPPARPATTKWLEGLTMGGDLRLRYEGFNQNEATRDRSRFRYRLRWKVVKKIMKDLEVGFRTVSGSNTDPSSAMQSLTGDFTFKNIFLDQVYAKYQPSFLEESFPSLRKAEIAAGKFENPFLKTSTPLVWDQDVMPEGIYESFESSFLENRFKPFVTLGQFILQENAASTDAEMYGFQSGVRWNPPGLSPETGMELTHAVSYYDFSDYARDSNFLVNGTSLAGGNTRTGSASFLQAGDFNVLQAYNEVKFKIKNLPLKIFSDFAINLADRTPDPVNRHVAYEYGLKLGEAKKKGNWEAGYYYAYLEPNAVVGAFNDSDFGTGHADKRGSAVQLRYRLTDYLQWGFTAYFVNNLTGADDETRRFQSDIDWVF